MKSVDSPMVIIDKTSITPNKNNKRGLINLGKFFASANPENAIKSEMIKVRPDLLENNGIKADTDPIPPNPNISLTIFIKPSKFGDKNIAHPKNTAKINTIR
jgi:hypothetical protein